jgi:hypothetical protein
MRSCAVTQEFPQTLCNLNVHKSPHLVPILSQSHTDKLVNVSDSYNCTKSFLY